MAGIGGAVHAVRITADEEHDGRVYHADGNPIESYIGGDGKTWSNISVRKGSQNHPEEDVSANDLIHRYAKQIVGAPTTKYFLNRFIYDFYSRRRATVAQNWSRSLRFLSTELANASFRAESQNVALLAAGGARDELQVSRVILRIPTQPSAAAQRHGRF